MKQLFIIVLLFISLDLFAQDIIIKNDKSEIKSKVVEIEPAVIKYKQFNFQSGPTYSIDKHEVFMIVYQNGKRETFMASNESNGLSSQGKQVINVTEHHNGTTSLFNPTDPDLLVNYKPFRLVVYYKSVDGGEIVSPEISFERKISKNINFFNWGVALGYTYMSIETGEFENNNAPYMHSETHSINGYLYGSAYLPVNLITGKTVRKNTGLFPFVRLGLYASSLVDGYTGVLMPGNSNTYTPVESSTSFDLGYDLGADYKFSKGFGLSVVTARFKQFAFGMNFQFNKKK